MLQAGMSRVQFSMSAVGIATHYWLEDRGIGVPVPVVVKNFRYSYIIQTGPGVHPTSYPIGTGVKRPGLESDHSPPASAEVKKTWIYTSTPPYTFMA
jgi:hypothetical protein